MPERKTVHAIVDNDATHKHPKVRAMARHPSPVGFHFTPTSASWLNAVEGFFAKLTKKRLKRGVFRSQSQRCHPSLPRRDQCKPKALYLDQGPNKIIATVKRGNQMLNSIH